MPDSSLIELRNLCTFTAAGVNLTVSDGERVAIIGASGAGKTVLLRVLLGLLKPVGGEVRLLGRPVQGRPADVEGLGVSFQEPGLFDAWTVAENLRAAAPAPLSDEQLREHLADVGLEAVPLGQSPARLSGGQRKRVSMLRALLRATRLLVADEPTSGLDPGSTGEISELLARKTGGHGPALLMTTHDYGLACQLCQRVLLLTRTGIDDVTPPEDLSPEEKRAFLREKAGAEQQPPQEASTGRKAQVLWGFWANLLRFAARGLPLPILAMALLGIVVVVQSASAGFMDMSRWVPEVAAKGIFREMAPLVVGLLLAATIGARISAEVAAMSYSAQLDSMRLLGISCWRKLLLPFAGAAIIIFPVAILLGALAGLYAGSMVAHFAWSGLTITTTRFMHLAHDSLGPLLVLACLVKGVAMGAAVSCSSYLMGSRAAVNVGAIGGSVTAAAVASSISVVIVDAILSTIFFA